MGAEFEDVIEGKLHRIGRITARRLPQPGAVLDVLFAEQNVPAIGCLADHRAGEIAEADEVRKVDRVSRRRNKMDDSRRNRR